MKKTARARKTVMLHLETVDVCKGLQEIDFIGTHTERDGTERRFTVIYRVPASLFDEERAYWCPLDADFHASELRPAAAWALRHRRELQRPAAIWEMLPGGGVKQRTRQLLDFYPLL